MKRRAATAVLFGLICLGNLGAETNLYGGFDAASFRQLKPARQTLDLNDLDTNLLAAAVFHETNARRQVMGVPPVTFSASARKAAAIQARIMAERGSISQVNPNREEYRTLQDRLEAAGLKGRFAAENVATAFGWRYESGKAFYQRKEKGKIVISYSPKGKPIPTHTYVSFAQSLLDGWMNSPGHRKNILDPRAETLGASCVPGAGEGNTPIPKFYCAQVFYSPF